jgi:hypothetical protein
VTSDRSPALQAVVRELEAHAAESGWDRPERLFALVDTADLIRREPQLAEALGLEQLGVQGEPEGLTPIEQEPLPQGTTLEQVLAEIVWPGEVAGCAVIVAAALRGGGSACALRLRSHDDADSVLTSPDLVPGLLALLHGTLELEENESR